MDRTAKQGPPGGSICQATRNDGEACQAPAGVDGFCFWHSARQRPAMLAASGKGGSRKQLPLPSAAALTPKKARGLMAAILAALLQGSLDATTARSAGYLLSVDLRLLEVADLERRITALEEAQANNGRRPR
jgi:hypothetical protein